VKDEDGSGSGLLKRQVHKEIEKNHENLNQAVLCQEGI
jgi:hypothetical protein